MGDYRDHDYNRCGAIRNGEEKTWLTGGILFLLLIIKFIFIAGLGDVFLGHITISLYAICSVLLVALYVWMVPAGVVGIFVLACGCNFCWILPIIMLEFGSIALLLSVDFLFNMALYGLYIGLPVVGVGLMTFLSGAIQALT